MPRRKDLNGRPWRRLREQILAANNICALCGQPGADSIDHIIPPSKGGHPRALYNLQPAHRTCNTSKGDRPQATPHTTSRNW